MVSLVKYLEVAAPLLRSPVRFPPRVAITFINSRCISSSSLHRKSTYQFLLSKDSVKTQDLWMSQPIINRALHLSSQWNAIVPFKLSDIGEGIKEVTIKEWFIKVGDKVAQFDQICEVQSDKASVTITSRFDGIIRKVHYKVDEIALVGSALVDVEVQDSLNAKADVQVQEGDAIQIGQQEDEPLLPTPSTHSDKVLATPAVRRMAMEHKIDLRDVRGTGRDGRVLKEDILNHVGSGKKSESVSSKPPLFPTKPTVTPQSQPAQPEPHKAFKPIPLSVSVAPSDKKEPIKGYTKTMIKTMTASNGIPHFLYCDELDVSGLVSLRNEIKGAFEEYGLKLTFMPFFLKAASLALKQFPILNSSIDLTSESIIYKGSHNIGVAMDTKLGLIVPNIKNVQDKSLLEISAELARLQQCAKKGSVSPDDLSGGTITLSNIGSIGGTYAKPIIVSPEVAIGAIGKFQTLPRFDSKGDLVKAQVATISWSADHRIIDGATMARFSNLWKSYSENPSSMLLHLK